MRKLNILLQKKKYAKIKKGEKPTRKKFRKISKVGLSVNSIAMSRVSMDQGVLSLKESNSNDKTRNDSFVDSELTAQSTKTKINTYSNRSSSPEQINSMRNFAAQIGDAMESYALKISAEVKKTTFVTIDKVNQILNIPNKLNNIEELSQELKSTNTLIGLLGDFNFEGKTIMITSPITAALIKSRIINIDKQLPDLRLDCNQKAIKAVYQKAFLVAALQEFPEFTKSEGDKLLEDYNFPFASMI